MRTRIALATLLLVTTAVFGGCAGGAAPGATADTEGIAATDTAGVTETLAPEAATSDDAAFIREMGKSHKGETLHLLVVASEASQAAADKLLLDLLPSFGDRQVYLVAEPTAHLKGFKAGSWVIFEAYRAEPSPEDIEFMDRGPSPAYVQQSTILCDDPIPVVEDLEADIAP
jgi:hypothetical protein